MSEKWIEQVEENGYVFIDNYLHPECDFIRLWDSREEFAKHRLKRKGLYRKYRDTKDCP